MNKPFQAETKTGTKPKEPLAIVGIGCRFPGGGNTPEAFWDLLTKGTDTFSPVPEGRWDSSRFNDVNKAMPGTAINFEGGFLSEKIEEFDAEFFGISPREAACIDPQQRILMEIVWEALEDGGIAADQLGATPVGVYMGGFTTDTFLTLLSPSNRDYISSHTATSATLGMLANRISYQFDFRGPSLTIDTACSSSLVALNYACRDLWSGACDLAISGGVNVMSRPEFPIAMTKGGFLAHNSRSKAFSAEADGYGRGEGGGVIVLKRLSEAMADGDKIYATLRGVGVNQDGRTSGITVPNPEAQQQLISLVYEDFGIDPSDVEYVEAHGTGTPVGDPIEMQALGNAIGSKRAGKTEGTGNAVCPVGSVKANIGHQEAAAGIASTIKSAMVLSKRQVPPQINFSTPNPNIPFKTHGFRVPTTLEDLPRGENPSCVSINSFGFGGSNAHAVLGEAPERSAIECPSANAAKNRSDKSLPAFSEGVHLVPVSARSAAALSELGTSFSRYFDEFDVGNTPQFDASVAAMALRRSHSAHRLAVVAQDSTEAAQKLASFAQGTPETGVFSGRAIGNGANEARPIVFVFTGMGPQWWDMGRDLFETSPVYRAAVEMADAAFVTHSGWSILAEMEAAQENSRMASNEIAQPANFIIQVGLLAVWRALGITPSAIVGHSVGEVAAAYAAGTLTLDEAAKVSYHRSRCQQKMAGKGKMLAVGLSAEDAAQLADLYPGQVSVAAVNAPQSVALAGDADTLGEIAQMLTDEEVFNKLLRVEVAYHSHQMDPLEAELKSVLAGLTPQAPTVPLWSTVTGQEVTTACHDAQYWWQNVRQKVCFADAIEDLGAQGFDLFVEVGPHPVLAPAIKQVVTSISGQNGHVDVLRSLYRGANERDTVMAGLAEMYCAGAALDWTCLHGTQCAQQDMPLYPWQRERFWMEYENRASETQNVGKDVLLGARQDGPDAMWQSELTHTKAAYLQDHTVDGALVFPGAGYVQAMLAAQKEHGTSGAGVLEDISFKNALVFEASDKLVLRTQIHDTGISIFGRRAGEGDTWIACAEALLSGARPYAVPDFVDLEALKQSIDQEIEIAPLYQFLEDRGLLYGPAFQGLKQLFHKGNTVLAHIRLQDDVALKSDFEFIHPTMLDAGFQALIAGMDTSDPLYDPAAIFVPVSIGRMSLMGPVGRAVWCTGTITQTNPSTLEGALTFFDESGQVLAKVDGFKCQALHQAQSGAQDPLAGLFYQYDWVEAPQDGENIARSTEASPQWLVLGDGAGRAADVAHELRARGARVLQGHNATGFEKLSTAQVDGQTDGPKDGQYAFDFENPLHWAQLATDLGGADFAGILYLAQDTEADPTGEAACIDVLGIAQNAGTVQSGTEGENAPFSPAFTIVTQGSGAPRDGETAIGSGGQFALAGLGRVIANEYSALGCRLIDLGCGDDAGSVTGLIDEVLSVTPVEDEISLRQSGRTVHRLMQVDLAETETLAPVVGPSDRPFEIDFEMPGDINSARFVANERRAPADDEVELRIKGVALNFKDVLKIMGVLSEDIIKGTFFGNSVGMEVAAEVVTVGRNVTNLKLGDRIVAAIPNGGFRAFNTLKAKDVHWFPDHDDHDILELVGMPVVFVTALYGLDRVARVQPGEKVLLHSASGGVGLAAIQVAKHKGAEIYATAGSEEKRALLRSLGVEHVFDSRSLDFADDIRRVTQGAGMDVILNFLPGEAQEKSVGLLAPFGRFIEIGKRDIDENRGLGLGNFNRNLQFTAVDTDRMLAEKPALFDALLHEAWVGLDAGIFTPIVCQSFPISKFSEACHVMRRAEHVGKIVVKIENETMPIYAAPDVTPLCLSDASYLITGGFGGFGLELAKWLVDHGARSLVLVGRSGANTDAARTAVAEIEARGVRVHHQKVDMSDGVAVQDMMVTIKETCAPLRGIFHAAAALKDGMLAEMSADDFTYVMAAKATGALHLHRASLAMDLDYFVLFSSVSALVGNPGQGNYAAANTYLDGIAHLRATQGLPATSINWGALGEVGMAARDEKIAARLAQIGIAAIAPKTALDALERVLRRGAVQLGVMDVDWARWRQVNPGAATNPKFSNLTDDLQNDDDTAAQIGALLAQLEEGDQHPHLCGLLAQQIASVLRMPVERLDITQPLSEMGIDSLMMVDVQLAIEEGLGIEVSVMELSRGGSVARLAQDLLVRLLGKAGTATPPPNDRTPVSKTAADIAPEVGTDQVDSMSNAEVEQLLAQLALEEDA